MKILLKRIYLGEKYTIGHLSLNGEYFCDTIEDINRDLNKDGDLRDEGEGKVYAKTCIPFETYEVIVNKSPHFKRLLPRILNVEHFSGILIHNGTSEKSSAGCIILGENKTKGRVQNGTYYMNVLTYLILQDQKKGIKSYIEII
jgi:hypothetical protein